MLKAVKHNKTQLHSRRYAGRKENDDTSDGYKRTQEDEITSTVFGPLDYFPVNEQWEFFRFLFQTCNLKSDILPSGDPEHCEFKFWDRRQIEPDLVVRFEFPDQKKLIVLIEVKWESDLSGSDQLRKQWYEYLGEEEHKNAIHIFLDKTGSVGDHGPKRVEKPWSQKFCAIRWLHVRNTCWNLIDKSDVSVKLKCWAKDIDCFLGALRVRAFRGIASTEGEGGSIVLVGGTTLGGKIFFHRNRRFLIPPDYQGDGFDCAPHIFWKS